MRLRLLVAIPALLTASLAAHADTYQYDIQMDGQTAIFDESSILSTLTTVDAGSLLAGSSNDIVYLDLNPTAGSCPFVGGGNACLDMFLSPPYIDSAIFIDGPLTTAGVTYTNGSAVSVTFTDVSDVAATPEPSTLALLGTGLIGLAIVARKRFISSQEPLVPEELIC